MISWSTNRLVEGGAIMTSIGSFEAKTHLPELLKRVAKGERILITRRGEPVAMLVPPLREPSRDVQAVIDEMKALRCGNTLGGVSTRDLIEEGRRF
jgi:prevent-host-death family protein